MYVYCVVYYCIIAASYVRSVIVSWHTVTLLVAQWPMISLYSLKCFSVIQGVYIGHSQKYLQN